MLIPLWGVSQTQIGQKIEGVTGTDAFGQSVTISADGSTIAIGGDQYNSSMGHVRVYEDVSGTWTQIGNDIEGVATGNYCGSSIALSADGNIIAVGSRTNGSNGTFAGHVRVFENIAGTWTQIGNAIAGDNTWDESGTSVSLSADGSIVAIGAPRHDGNGNESGQVRVFENIAGTWTKIGSDIYGLLPGHGLGISTSLSSDGRVLAVGAVSRSTAATSASYAMIYENVSGNWTQIGQVINAVLPSDYSGRSVSLSSDGTIVAIGESGYSTSNNFQPGSVRIFENVSGTWTQIGSRIIGEASSDQSGASISLSADGDIIAIGAAGNDANGQNSGHVRVYRNISNTWVQAGSDIDGEEAQDYFGGSVSLSGSGDKLIVGATTLFTSTAKKGYAKVYDLSGVLSSDKFSQVSFTMYPNPATEVVNIELQDGVILESVTIYNNLGQKIKTINQNTVDVSTLAKGLYFVEVTTNHGKASKKIIIE
jgi:Flp pilus assembly pilin Flp